MSLSLQITQARSPGAVNRSVTFVDISSYINPGDVTRRHKARYRAASCFIALHAHRARVWSQGRLCEFPLSFRRSRKSSLSSPPLPTHIMYFSHRVTHEFKVIDKMSERSTYLRRLEQFGMIPEEATESYSCNLLVRGKIFNTEYLNFVIFYHTLNVSFSAFCILPVCIFKPHVFLLRVYFYLHAITLI